MKSFIVNTPCPWSVWEEHHVLCSLDNQALVSLLAPFYLHVCEPFEIGKHFWLWYAARRRMADSEPFILFHESQLYLFVEEGIYLVPPSWTYDDFKYFIWTLVGSDEGVGGIPPNLVAAGTPLFIIFTTSPVAKRWKRLHKTMQEPKIIVMNPWSKNEILQM
jgi:hypothetical protein